MKILRSTPLLVALAVLSACNLTGGESKKNGVTPSTEDQDALGKAVIPLLPNKAVALDSATSALQSMANDPGTPLDSAGLKNLLSANATFRANLATDPNDHEAQFGVAVTSLSYQMNKVSDTLQKMFAKGLGLGEEPDQLFQSNPTALVASRAFSARAFSDPQNSPAISDFQSLLETSFLPTVDSAIGFLNSCWKDPAFAYRFQVTIQGRKDSLTIGRADVGFALAGLRTARAYFTWVMAQNVDCNFPNQGFATDYAWIDTLGNLPKEGPTTASQKTAFSNLQTLLAPGSSFLTIRAGHQAAINALPAELQAISQLAKEAGNYSVAYQTNIRQGLVRLDADDNAKLAEVADSVNLFLGGMRTYTRKPHTESVYNYGPCVYDSTIGYTSCGSYSDVQYPGFSITFNAAKLITMPDHKVFLPRFSWNNQADWATKGPFSLLHGTTVTPIADFENLKINSPKDMAPYLEWADCTFAGGFAFQNTAAVLDQLEAMNEKSAASNGLYPTLSPL